MFLNDQETATDLLYYEAIAKTVVNLIRKTPDAPVTIGVHGDWGAGKSSVLKMLEGAFAADDRVLCLWFNGWTFEGFEDAKTVVIETIVDELRRARPTSTKVAEAAKKVLKRVDWLKLARKAGGFAFTATTGIPTFDQVKGLYDMAAGFLAKPQDHVSIEDLKGVADKAGDFLKEAPDDTNNLPSTSTPSGRNSRSYSRRLTSISLLSSSMISIAACRKRPLPRWRPSASSSSSSGPPSWWAPTNS